MSEQPRNEGKKGGGWRELPKGFAAKAGGSPAEPQQPQQPQAEGDDTWILEGAEEEAQPAAGARAQGVAPQAGETPDAGAPSEVAEEGSLTPATSAPEELFGEVTPDDGTTPVPETGPIEKFTAVGPVGFRSESRSDWAGDDLSATQLGMDLAEEERALREMEMSFASGVEDVEFTLVGDEAAGADPTKAQEPGTAPAAPAGQPWKLPPLAAPSEAAAAALAARLGAPRRSKPADSVAGAGSETAGSETGPGEPTMAGGGVGDGQPSQDELAETMAALSDGEESGEATADSPSEEAAGEPQADDVPAEGYEETAGETAFEAAPEDAEQEMAAEDAPADEDTFASEPEVVEPMPRRRGGRFLRTAAAAAVVLLGGTLAVLPWSEPTGTDTPTPTGPAATAPRTVARAEIARPVTKFELTPPVVSLTETPRASGGTQPVAVGRPGPGPGPTFGPTPRGSGPTPTPPVARGEDDELLQALDRALAGVPTAGGAVTDPGVVAPAPGPADEGGHIMALTSGSRALALLRNGAFFIGKVKRVDAAAVTLHLGTGELTLPRVDLKRLVALGAMEYQELAQGGSVLLKNRNRLVGQILQSQGQEGVTLDLQTAKITIPKEDIEEVTTRLPAPIEFGKEDDEVWFKRELEKERDRARRASKGADVKEEGEGPAIKVLGTVDELKGKAGSK